MILISHRGNINGVNLSQENSPFYIKKTLKKGYDVEIDVWFCNDNFLLGHDEPKYIINKSFLYQKGLWCHAKNVEALYEMLKAPEIHCFWHQKDDVILTSRCYLWTYPGKPLTKNSIAVLPEVCNWDMKNEVYAGVCSDYIERFKS